MIRQRMRIRFGKQDDLRWIGHRDLLRVLERLLRRARLKLSMTEGFHPKPRLSFPLALAVGISADEEVMELELAEAMEPDQLLAVLNEHTVPGLTFHSVEKAVIGEKKAQVESVVFEIPVPVADQPRVRAAIADFLAAESHLVEREKRAEPVDIRRDVMRLELGDEGLEMQLRTARDASVRPREVLAVLGLAELEHDGYLLRRSTVNLTNEKVTP
ncbi:MAG: DUF2344 domain-containing protein [Planctomycetota bacterium]|nr:MAG: DUF2344 domain-containing protein [Planctomycetota bacterium]